LTNYHCVAESELRDIKFLYLLKELQAVEINIYNFEGEIIDTLSGTSSNLLQNIKNTKEFIKNGISDIVQVKILLPESDTSIKNLNFYVILLNLKLKYKSIINL